MKDRRFTTQSAFTFIEVLVALAIAAIALLGLLRLHLLSMTSADAAQATTVAAFLAQEKIAEASASGYPDPGTKSGSVEQNGRRFAWRVEISNAQPQNTREFTLTGLRQIRAFVTWERGGGQKTLEMTTYVADSGIHE
jgi:general secretion pathway protein I